MKPASTVTRDNQAGFRFGYVSLHRHWQDTGFLAHNPRDSMASCCGVVLDSSVLGGKVENISSWEEEFEEEENESLLMLDGLEDLDESDYISSMLTWDEDGEREIAVDLAFGEQGIALMVNEVDIRPEQDALEQALVSAFREQLEL